MLGYYRRKPLFKQSFKDIVNSDDDYESIQRAIYDEICVIHASARKVKSNLDDYNVNDPNARRYRLLLSLWWSLPCGLNFVPYRINKGHTFGKLFWN